MVLGNVHMTTNMGFPQGFQYQLAALQAQAKAQQQQQHPGHAQLLQHMQAAQEQSQVLARAQAEAQARAHVEAQARARVQAAQANHAAQAQQAAAALAVQHRSLMNSGVTTAHEYYYAHAQRAAAAANIPEYLARLAAQHHHNQIATTASCATAVPRLLHPANKQQLLLHQHQQQLLQNSALRQHSQKQHMQITAAATLRQASTTAIPTPRLPTTTSTVIANQAATPTANPLSPLSSSVISADPSSSSGPGSHLQTSEGSSSVMGPHEDTRYHNFMADVMKLEKHISDCLLASTKLSENAPTENQQHPTPTSQNRVLPLEQTGVQ